MEENLTRQLTEHPAAEVTADEDQDREPLTDSGTVAR